MSAIMAGEIVRELQQKLEPKYGNEASSLSFMLLEEILGVSKNDIILNQPLLIETKTNNELTAAVQQLMAEVPIQHILGWADFFGHRFMVDNSTLIPRQETEELVDYVAKCVKTNGYASLLDIGTGTGCIAISVALECQNLEVTALDISAEALKVASLNANKLGVSLNLIEGDIFSQSLETSYDVVVSNPPYVLESEKKLMAKNVLEHDPSSALFVEDSEPLVFYEQITKISRTQLNQNGLLFFEINERFGSEVAELLKSSDFSDVTIMQDLNGKDRFVFGFRK